ncbi:MAG: glycosyltransferase family 4 protein [Ilumatobacteraceae bacterium]
MSDGPRDDSHGDRTVAVLVVPSGTHRVDPLADAVRAHHPDWDLVAVWTGDPQVRPAAAVPWASSQPSGVELVRSTAEQVEWRHALLTARRVLAGGARRAVLLWVGAVGVLGPLDPLANGDLTVVARTLAPLPGDGLVPAEVDLLEVGAYTTSVVAVGPGGLPAVDWLLEVIDADGDAPVGRWLERAAALFGAAVVDDPRIGVGRWRWDTDDPLLVDAADYDDTQPWVLDGRTLQRPRIDVAVGRRRAVLDAIAGQLTGARRPPSLPGGWAVDPAIRHAVRTAAPDEVPDPWNEAGAFRRWLVPRYWTALRDVRPDVAAAFPNPRSEGFRSWTETAFTADADIPFVVPPVEVNRTLGTAAELGGDGVNLVGYLPLQASLGDVARRLADALGAARIPVSTISATRSASPPLPGGWPTDEHVRFDATIAVVTADQLPYQRADLPELFDRRARLVGYWFWELEHVPAAMRRNIALVDEIWAGSRFVADAFAAVSRVPVRHVPVPVAEPVRSTRTRADFAPLAPFAGRPILLVALDHFSVTERKNPVGAVEAFRRAFAPGEGPVLVVKSMNAGQRWPHHARVLHAAAGRPDIVVWDEHLPREDQMAVVADADALVSLHRAEGLGLHLAEAMWLGTPTIATRYSGNVDFMDDGCALLVDASMTHVTGGQGIYPPSAVWADPDVDEAAAAMRRLVSDDGLRKRLALAGRAKMTAQPTLRDTGELIGRLLQRGG